jgi:hypothetical protein
MESSSTGRPATPELRTALNNTLSNDRSNDDFERACAHRFNDESGRTWVYVSASHLGSLDLPSAQSLLRHIRSEVGVHGGAVVGLDLSSQRDKTDFVGRGDADAHSRMMAHLNETPGRDLRVRSPGTPHVRSVLPKQECLAGVPPGHDPSVRRFQHSLVAIGQISRRADLEISDCWTEFGVRHALVLLTAVPSKQNERIA